MIKTGSYLNAHYNHKSDTVTVWERNKDEERTIRHIPAPYYFYAKDSNGEFTSIYGDKLKRLDFDNKADYEHACGAHRQKFESDIRPMDRVLMDMYYGNPVPSVHYTLLDIEVDYDKTIGFSSTENPYAPINAVTIYHQWLNKYITIAVPPGSITDSVDNLFDIDDPILNKSEIILVKSEKALLEILLDYVQDSDVVSGWNSEFFDLPYLMRRTELVLGKAHMSKWSYFEAPPPKYTSAERFGSTRMTVKIYGRDHLDYLELFKKFTFEGRASYSLAAIADEELTDVPKLEYDGSLADLYRDDFVLFIKYNIRDVEILEMLDRKFKFIDLAAELAHANTVPLEGVMGSVRIIDTGIINYCHHELKLIVQDKENKPGDPIKGAMVLEPKVGLHEMVGSIDINSLYPSTYRALNISPEKIIGQFINKADDWKGISQKDENKHILDFESGDYAEYTGDEWYEILQSKKWSISAYGTVFDQSNGPGFIPLLLADWYANRKRLQKKSAAYKQTAKDLKAAGKGDSVEAHEAQSLSDFYDRKQLVYKILLNSLYGATINEWCRFYDPRLGASTTFTGRQITSNMAITAGEILTGERTPVIQTPYQDEKGVWRDRFTCSNPSIIYGDTDSCYFKMIGITDNAEAIIVADMVGDGVNASFPPFMQENFCCTDEFKDLIKCGREVVADRAIFQAKKKYMLRCINIDGFDIEPGSKKSMKAMGSDIKKSDTPKFIQKFLLDVANKILAGTPQKKLEVFVNDYRANFRRNIDKFNMARIMSVNNLDKATDEYEKFEVPGLKRVNLSGHARAAINFNRFIKKISSTETLPIISGQKVKIFFVKPNEENFDSIAMASDLTEFPSWFNKHFELDLTVSEEKLIDAKLKSMFDPIGWEIPTLQGALTNSLLVF